MFTVTKTFISGLLKGITITEQTSVAFVEGKTYKNAIGGSDYIVTSVKLA